MWHHTNIDAKQHVLNEDLLSNSENIMNRSIHTFVNIRIFTKTEINVGILVSHWNLKYRIPLKRSSNSWAPPWSVWWLFPVRYGTSREHCLRFKPEQTKMWEMLTKLKRIKQSWWIKRKTKRYQTVAEHWSDNRTYTSKTKNRNRKTITRST